MTDVGGSVGSGGAAPGRWPRGGSAGNSELATLLRAAEWRHLVRTLYLLAGSPPVSGYTTYMVKRILWSDSAPEGDFLAELLVALQRPGAGRAGRARELLAAGSRAPFGDTTDHQGDRQADWPQGDELLTRASAEARTPAVEGPLESKSLGPTPLNPAVVSSTSEFLKLMKLLMAWRNMTLRELEARAKVSHAMAGEASWLPRSTISDLFRGNRLPSRPVLEAFVKICGLTSAEQERWLEARDRLTMDPASEPASAVRGSRRRSHSASPTKDV
jgi:transcriptional regulator with XRE-family HTH domain